MNNFYLLLTFIFGLAVGSFLNVLVWRVRENLSFVNSRSICTKCRQKILWYDNIPIISFFVLGRRCRFCKEEISWQYPAVEFSVGLLFLFIAACQYGQSNFITLAMLFDWVVVLILAFIFIYDLKYQEILDRTTLIPAVFVYLFQVAVGWQPWWGLLIGAGIGGGFFLLQYILSRGRWIGGGDIRLGVLMGVILGWPNIILALIIAYVLGAFISLTLVGLKRKNLQSETPFGTYLAFATFIAMFWGPQIVSWYLGLLR